MEKPGDRTDADRDETGRADVTAYTGFPKFDHNQWTVEGEIERLGAFSRGSHHVRGWRRATAVLLAVLLLLPIAVSLVRWVFMGLAHLAGW